MESQREQYVRTRAEAYRLRAEVERLQAEIASKDRLLPSLLAEGKAQEQARAERAEALVAEMLVVLRDGGGDTFAGTLEAVANQLRGGRRADWLRAKAALIRTAIARAEGPK